MKILKKKRDSRLSSFMNDDIEPVLCRILLNKQFLSILDVHAFLGGCGL